MPRKNIKVSGALPGELSRGLDALRAALMIEKDFEPQVQAEAERLAAGEPTAVDRIDMSDVDFITVDPLGAKDLDQAMHITREGEGFVVRYAIDDVAAWVPAGSLVDIAANQRGQTFYAPDGNALLYPAVIAQQAASLLPQDPARPAYVWTFTLDAQGAVTSTTIEKALVRSRQQYDYPSVQKMIDDGTAPETFMLLREVGILRERQEMDRGGVSLPIPEQQVEANEDGTWRLSFRSPLPCENWNAQISLMTGMAAADLMIAAKVGILRTLPPVEPASLARLHRVAKGLGIDWPKDEPYASFLRSLDPTDPKHLAMLQQCTTLFRGAGYVSFNGALPTENHAHNALATFYAHCTAPLRRLVDRYVLEICWCVTHGTPIPSWATDALTALPEVMQSSNQREKKFERGVADLVEALLLQHRVGEVFDATVVDYDQQRHLGSIIIESLAVEARAKGKLPVGEHVRVRLTKVDVPAVQIWFDTVD